MRYYRKHFKNKVVFCNCDDPYESNFFKYFALRFNQLGLKKLICTCYNGSPVQGDELMIDWGDFAKEPKKIAYKVEITEVRDLNGATGFTKSISTIEAENLPSITTRRHESNIEEAIAEEVTDAETLNLSDIGRQMIEKALERNGGNRKKAAAELGISDRTLYRKIKQYGLDK